MSVRLRPGIYSSYEVNSEKINSSGKTVGICAAAGDGESGSFAAYADAVAAYGSDCSMTKIIKTVLNNGASEVKAIPVKDGDYAAAFALMVNERDVEYIVCDSEDAAVHAALKTALQNANEDRKYKLGIVQMHGGAAELASAAQSLNCERIVLCGNSEVNGIEGSVAAAVAGMLASHPDPALPLNGAVLQGISQLSNSFSDAQVEQLLHAGVTPVEEDSGDCVIVRGITTRTDTDGAYDASLRDINTMLVINDVLPAVSAELKRYFVHTKNTAQTRGAIRIQTMLVLEEKLKQEIIASYGNVRAAADENDPTICRVSFSFSVMSGLNVIELLACLTV